MTESRASRPRAPLAEVSMPRLGLNPQTAAVVVAAVLLLSACNTATAPGFTFPAVAATPAGSSAPTSPATLAPTAARSSAPTPAPTPATSPAPSPSAPASVVPSASASATAPAPTSAPAPAPSGSSGGPIGVPPAGVAIYVSEWSVGLPTSMLAGQVNFAITNIGTIQHELLVFKTDLAPSAVPLDSNGNIVENGPA
jgi:hypothetical protein